MNSKISTSLMCADFLNLGKDIKILESIGMEFLHIDIMDGVFVPNYTLGTDFVKKIKEFTAIPLDIHLMVDCPDEKIEWFGFGKGDYVSIHFEADNHFHRAIQHIHDRGAKAMLALNPSTPINVIEDSLPDLDAVLIMTVDPGYAGQKLIPQTLDKIKRLRLFMDEKGYQNVEIEVDGNVSFINAKLMREAGANIFVAGSSSLFAENYTIEEAATLLRYSIR